jgi:hypothetical protein
MGWEFSQIQTSSAFVLVGIVSGPSGLV